MVLYTLEEVVVKKTKRQEIYGGIFWGGEVAANESHGVKRKESGWVRLRSKERRKKWFTASSLDAAATAAAAVGIVVR